MQDTAPTHSEKYEAHVNAALASLTTQPLCHGASRRQMLRFPGDSKPGFELTDDRAFKSPPMHPNDPKWEYKRSEVVESAFSAAS